MTDDRTGIDWAKTAAFDGPVSLGEIEREVSSRPLVDIPAQGALPTWLMGVVLALPAFAPAIGAVILFANPASWGGEASWSVDFSRNAFVAGFLIGAAYAVVAVITWLVDGRKRAAPALTVLTTTAVTYTATEILIRLPGFAGPPPDGISWPLVLAVGSVVALILMLTVSKPRRSESAIERDIDSLDREGKRLLYNRTEVLRILVQRGVIPREKMSKAILAPLGGWSDLD